jgi:molecular chaperone HscB
MDFKQNHFELFGLTPVFRIDPGRLEAAYREIQNQVHPDRFASGGDAEKRLSMQWSTRVNEAYQTLKSALTRARYLLQLQGIEALAETAMPPAFLLQQMEWHEAIAEARASRKMNSLDDLMGQMRAEAKRVEIELASQIDDVQDYAGAAVSVRKLKFLHKLIEEIGDAQEELELA